jgi:hypothetical protein
MQTLPVRGGPPKEFHMIEDLGGKASAAYNTAKNAANTAYEKEQQATDWVQLHPRTVLIVGVALALLALFAILH